MIRIVPLPKAALAGIAGAAFIWECALRRSADEAAEQLSAWLKQELSDHLEL